MGMVTGYDCYKAMTELEQRRWQREVIKHFNVGSTPPNTLLEMRYITFSHFIKSSFIWSETKHGTKYWVNISEKYKLHDQLNPGNYFKTNPPKTF
jgi:hypothetical protein